jgi:hypothetical protein
MAVQGFSFWEGGTKSGMEAIDGSPPGGLLTIIKYNASCLKILAGFSEHREELTSSTSFALARFMKSLSAFPDPLIISFIAPLKLCSLLLASWMEKQYYLSAAGAFSEFLVFCCGDQYQLL